MRTLLGVRRAAVVSVVSVLATVVSACGGESADLAEPVEVQFRTVPIMAVDDFSDQDEAPESVSKDVTQAKVYGELGEELVTATETFVDNAHSAIEDSGQQLSEQLFPQLGYTEDFAAYGDLAPEAVAVLPPQWPYFLPDIGCAQIDAMRKAASPPDAEVVACDDGNTGDGRLKYSLGPSELGNADVASAEAQPDGHGGHLIAITFTGTGAETWQRLTSDNVGEQIAIVVDGVVRAAPTVQQAIAGGSAHLTGDYTRDEAEELAAGIEAGAAR